MGKLIQTCQHVEVSLNGPAGVTNDLICLAIQVVLFCVKETADVWLFLPKSKNVKATHLETRQFSKNQATSCDRSCH